MDARLGLQADTEPPLRGMRTGSRHGGRRVPCRPYRVRGLPPLKCSRGCRAGRGRTNGSEARGVPGRSSLGALGPPRHGARTMTVCGRRWCASPRWSPRALPPARLRPPTPRSPGKERASSIPGRDSCAPAAGCPTDTVAAGALSAVAALFVPVLCGCECGTSTMTHFRLARVSDTRRSH